MLLPNWCSPHRVCDSRLGCHSKVASLPAALGDEQERLTQAIGDLFQDLQLGSLGNPALEPMAPLQYFSGLRLSRVVADDFTMSRVNQENWLYYPTL
jgi:hypothetical protein